MYNVVWYPRPDQNYIKKHKEHIKIIKKILPRFKLIWEIFENYESFEDIIEDTQRIIAQSATDAQSDADISYLHEDILGAINDMFIDGEFNFDDGQYQGQIEIGDLISKNGEHYSRGLEYLQDELESGYPDINDVSYNVLHKELEGSRFTIEETKVLSLKFEYQSVKSLTAGKNKLLCSSSSDTKTVNNAASSLIQL